MSTPSSSSKTAWPGSGGRCCSSPTIVTCSIDSPPRCWSSIAARATCHGRLGYARLPRRRAAREEQAVAAEESRKNLARSELAWLRRGARPHLQAQGPHRSGHGSSTAARRPPPEAEISICRRSAAPVGAGRKGRLGGARPCREALPGTSRLGTKVVELEGVGHQRRWSALVVPRTRAAVDPGDRLGIVGPNGARQVDAARDHRRAHRARRRNRSRSVPPSVSATTTSSGCSLDLTERVRDAVAGRPVQPRGKRRRSSSISGSTTTRSLRPSVCSRVESADGCSCSWCSPQPERPAAR